MTPPAAGAAASPSDSPRRRRRAGRIVLDPGRVREWPIRHIPRGAAILAALDQLGCLTNAQVAELLYCDAPNARGQARTERAARAAANRTLQRLWHAGYVDRQRAILTSRRGHWYQHFVNVLTPQGIEAVGAYYRERGDGRRPRAAAPPRLGPRELEHALAINDLHVLIARACRQRGRTLGLWRDERQLAALNRAGLTHLDPLPAALAALRRGAEPWRLYFLELDLGSASIFGATAGREAWRERVRGYERYCREVFGGEAVFAGLPPPTILTVTTGPEQLASLVEATLAAGGTPGRYWYTTREALWPAEGTAPATRWWEPLWHLPGERAPRSLLAQPLPGGGAARLVLDPTLSGPPEDEALG
jgi:hypothetical protein